ncbi:type IV pilus twitching motility protein PilT [Anaerocolumna chitinilytica]|uniref:Twitching motility protein n=1 Tax=Anaerocolumna chitinilytica TaxID=1727145 RepID=A0A7I8DQP6_9FIRM|nr:type IV pilus twitching motility protein PilT [Anaerocolumna chitinilytica]BCJ99987.1 twitching motility protein [Anaerocolumna chitinilytica]
MITINELLTIAKQCGASDLHVTVGIAPKVRINGELTDLNYNKMLPDDTMALVLSITPEHFKKVLEEKGEADFSYSIPGLGRYRVNIFKQRGSVAMVMRLVGTIIPQASDLGVPESVIELTKKKRGLVLVTGPTGSGKSTTLASLIDIINSTYNTHVITLEDPIEYLHNHKKAVVNQREIGLDTYSYANALRAALREDPDVILVGEMRDLDTIATAITAAETGHLVLSTLHTIGAAATIDRVIDVFPPHQQQQIRIQLASVLESVISQQLIPTADSKGRVAAYEVMHATNAIRNLIREAKTHQIPSIIQTSKKAGMQTMDDAIYELYLRGRIAADKAINFAQDPAALDRKLF